MPGLGLEFYKPMISPREGEFSSSLRKVVNQAMLVFDVASGKIRLILNHLAALFRESGSRFFNAFYRNFENRSHRRTALNKEINVFSVKADHVWFFVRDLESPIA